jgi:hypothetical protein
MESQRLDTNEILGREFDYAAQTALQANEDRARVFGYYVATGATMLAAMLLADLRNTQHLTVLAVLFGGLAVLGIMSILKLAKLRLAWTDSVRAMCQIKRYYIEATRDAGLGTAFRWTADTIPPVGKKWTVAFVMAATLMLLSSSASGAAVMLGVRATGGSLSLPAGAAAGVVILIGQLVVWFAACRE